MRGTLPEESDYQIRLTHSLETDKEEIKKCHCHLIISQYRKLLGFSLGYISTQMLHHFLPKNKPLHYFNSCFISSFILSSAAYLFKGYELSLLASCLPFPQLPVHLFVSHVNFFQGQVLEHILFLKKCSRADEENPSLSRHIAAA